MIILVPTVFVSAITITMNTRKLDPKKKDKIENNSGLVQQNGKALYDENGNYLVLRGVNAGNLLTCEGWLSPFSIGEDLDKNGNIIYDNDNLPTYPKMPMEEVLDAFNANPKLIDEQRSQLIDIYRENWFSESDFEFIKNDLNLNMIRLPFYWRNILVEKDGVFTRKSEEEAFGYIDSFVENCKKYDLYCILDLHGTPGGQNGYEHSGDMTQVNLWHNKTYQDATADLWKFIAEHYMTTRKDLASTIACYDLMNEPVESIEKQGTGTKTKITYPVFDQIYDVIRETGDNHVISIEGMWNYNHFEDPKKWGWENVLYQTHLYNWNHDYLPYFLFDGYHEWQLITHDYDVPFYMGEFTFFEEPKDWKNHLEMYERRGYSWSMWTYKSSVTGWWTSSWSIYTQKLELWDGKKKVNLGTDDFDTIKAGFEATKTKNCELSNTYTYITDFTKSLNS